MDEEPLPEPTKQSIFSRIRASVKIPFGRKKPTDTMPDDGTEPLLDDVEAAELKQMIESLTAPSAKKSSYTIPKIVTDAATPSPAASLPIPTPQPKKPWVRFANSIIVVLAFLAGMYGVIVLYNQFPTHPSIIVGIVAIAASTGVVTGITARG